MVVSQASETVNLFVDRLFLSRLGKLFIAGAMTGGLTTYNMMSFFIGIVGYVNAIVAQNDGAGNKRACARATAQSLRLAFLGWPLLMLTIPLVRMAFEALGQHSPAGGTGNDLFPDSDLRIHLRTDPSRPGGILIGLDEPAL